MKTNYHNVGTVQKSNRKVVEKGEIDTPYTHIHYYPIHMLGTCTSTIGDIYFYSTKLGFCFHTNNYIGYSKERYNHCHLL